MTENEFKGYLSSYPRMSEMLKTHSYDEIISAAAALGGISTEALADHLMDCYGKGRSSGAYQFVLRDLLKNIEQYDWLFSRLEDDRSRFVFANLIGYRLLPAKSFLEAAYDGETPQYFDKNIISCNKNEVFVDCGGFTGDTAEMFIRQFGQYKRIYVYEPSSDNIRTCQNNLKKYPNITIRQCGVGETSATLSIHNSSESSTFMEGRQTTDPQGVRIVSLDDDIQETITFLKMDIEGFEIPALLGAKKHIREDFPKLATCTYHIISDMWEIPRLIDAIHPGYRFFIRHYHYPENWETVLYAIPPEKPEPPLFILKKKRKRVVALAWDEGWENAQLLKDCGVIPYLLHKNHNCDVSMVGGRRPKEEYTNQQYLPGVEMEFLPDGSLQAKADYLAREAKNIDCLQIYGCYDTNIPMVDIYKTWNPEGKVFVIMDPNSFWMDRIQWAEPKFQKFLSQCDVLGSTVHSIQDYLNEKWPCIIELTPNGFYHLTERQWKPSFKNKKNVIFTAARLGIKQKATNVLLEAFASIAPQIPDWELRLAGSVADEFQGYLAEFWEQHLELRDRIHFLGHISDREQLYSEYLNSKIFALPSKMEGGICNAVAEALTAGNAVAITKIDGYLDATDQGRCGAWSEIDDVEGYARILLQLCRSKDLENMCGRAYEYANESLDLEKISARIYYLLFREEG